MRGERCRSCPASLSVSPRSFTEDFPNESSAAAWSEEGRGFLARRSTSATESLLKGAHYGPRTFHRSDSASDRVQETETTPAQSQSADVSLNPGMGDVQSSAAASPGEGGESSVPAASGASSSSQASGSGVTTRTGRRYLSRNDSAQREELPDSAFPFPGPMKERSPGLFRESYRVLNSIGSGAFSRVRVVQERRRDLPSAERQVWACKTLSMPPPGAEVAEGQSSWEEVINEIQVMSRLNHPCIVHLKEYFVEGHTVHIVMELMRGGELLHAVVERGSLAEEDAREIATKLLDTLSYLHSVGIAHRDLKLENLLMSDENDITSVKIADFGLAKWSQGNPMETICGTPLYLAPEVLTVTGIREPNLRISQYGVGCDIWASGVILYILLSGHPPFHNESLPVMFDDIRRANYNFYDPAWAMVSDGAKDLVVRLLTLDPNERIPAGEALTHPWILGDMASLRLS